MRTESNEYFTGAIHQQPGYKELAFEFSDGSHLCLGALDAPEVMCSGGSVGIAVGSLYVLVGGICLRDNQTAMPAKRKPGRPRVHASGAARQAAYLARKELHQVTVALPQDVVDGLAAYMRRHSMDGEGLTQSQVVAKLLRTQLLRKR